jgi:hypothetical protein
MLSVLFCSSRSISYDFLKLLNSSRSFAHSILKFLDSRARESRKVVFQM